MKFASAITAFVAIAPGAVDANSILARRRTLQEEKTDNVAAAAVTKKRTNLRRGRSLEEHMSAPLVTAEISMPQSPPPLTLAAMYSNDIGLIDFGLGQEPEMEIAEMSMPLESAEMSMPLVSAEMSMPLESAEMSMPLVSAEMSMPLESAEMSMHLV